MKILNTLLFEFPLPLCYSNSELFLFVLRERKDLKFSP